MYVYMCIVAYIYIYRERERCIKVYVHQNQSIHICRYEKACMYIYIYVYIHIRIYVHIIISSYSYIRMPSFRNKHLYIHIFARHTYTHIYWGYQNKCHALGGLRWTHMSLIVLLLIGAFILLVSEVHMHVTRLVPTMCQALGVSYFVPSHLVPSTW